MIENINQVIALNVPSLVNWRISRHMNGNLSL